MVGIVMFSFCCPRKSKPVAPEPKVPEPEVPEPEVPEPPKVLTHENVTQMFTDAKARHFAKGDGVSDMFANAWRTYKKLSPEEQKLVRR
jgi:hypothetical protein